MQKNSAPRYVFSQIAHKMQSWRHQYPLSVVSTHSLCPRDARVVSIKTMRSHEGDAVD